MPRIPIIERCVAAAHATLVVLALLILSLAHAAEAAELQVISAGAVRGVLRGMIDTHAKSTGHSFKLTIGSTGLLRDTLASGAPADLIIASAPLMAELEKSGKMTPGSRVDIGRIGLGVVVRAGVPFPDVSTPEAVKTTLLAAKSIAHTDPKLGGTAYLHMMKLADAWGIRDAIAAKGVNATGGDDAVAKVADGKADLTLVLISEIHAPNARLVAPLPEAIQLWTIYAAAIPAASTQPALARELVAALTGPALREHWTKAGWQPPR